MRRFACGRAVALDPAKVRACAAGADGAAEHDDWEKCSGGVVVDVVAEGWGQGHARASALGVAGMMASLAAAANGQAEVRKPHLVERLARRRAPKDRCRSSRPRAASGSPRAEPNRLSHDAAEVILSGLSYSHRAGTARLACEQVFDAHTCRDMDWIAGKTGTPTLSERRPLARRAVATLRGAAPREDEERAGGVRPAASLQVVRRGVSHRARRSALDQGDRRAHRAQLAQRTPAAFTAPAITAPIPPPRSRCRSPGAKRATCPETRR